MVENIERYRFNKSTNIKEHNDIVGKLNEVIDTLNATYPDRDDIRELKEAVDNLANAINVINGAITTIQQEQTTQNSVLSNIEFAQRAQDDAITVNRDNIDLAEDRIEVLEDETVKIVGNQDIDGTKIFIRDVTIKRAGLPQFKCRNENMDLINGSSGNVDSGYTVHDVSDRQVASIFARQSGNNYVEQVLKVVNSGPSGLINAYCRLRIDADGTVKFIAPATNDNAVGEEVATARWVNTKINALAIAVSELQSLVNPTGINEMTLINPVSTTELEDYPFLPNGGSVDD